MCRGCGAACQFAMHLFCIFVVVPAEQVPLSAVEVDPRSGLTTALPPFGNRCASHPRIVQLNCFVSPVLSCEACAIGVSITCGSAKLLVTWIREALELPGIVDGDGWCRPPRRVPLDATSADQHHVRDVTPVLLAGFVSDA